MRHRPFFKAIMIGLAVGFAILAQPAAGASITLSAGFDLFATVPTTTYVNIGTATSPNVVFLKGDPGDLSSRLGGIFLADTDTIVQRTGPTQTIGIGGTATFTLHLAALDLESVAPVLLSGNLYNVQVLGGTLLGFTEKPGSIAITATDIGGGTFTSTLPVAAELIFTPVSSGEPSIPNQPFSDTFSSVVPGIWSTMPRSDDAHTSQFPAGGFYAGADSEPGHAKVLTQEQAMLAAHGVLPAQTPEPGSWIMLLTAGVIVPVCTTWGRRRVRSSCAAGQPSPGD
jgi:hypothetical protein